MTAVDMIRALTPNSDDVSAITLQALVDVAEDDFKAECCRDDVPAAATSIIARMAAHRYGQMGAAGLQTESWSGASETYLTDYPEDLKRSMHRYRKVRLL